MCKTMDNMFVLEHNSNALCVTKILPSSKESMVNKIFHELKLSEQSDPRIKSENKR